MKFSRRTEWDLSESDFARRAREARVALAARGMRLLDLTVANPTVSGFEFDMERLLRPLAEAAASRYHPEAFGMLQAREAVATYYHDAGADMSPANICLTTSTSEAYSFLFRLLCDHGDEVLVASPSYPLFDFIAGLDGVRLVPYTLLYHDGWFIDFHSLQAAITSRTRAVIVVHPNNPTGNYANAVERSKLQEICAERGLALIVDEVFLDYPLNEFARQPSFLNQESSALTFVLSGISKVCALPQMKCSWIASAGPVRELAEATSRLEVIADTFLSMNAPVQHALPGWLANRHGVQRQILARAKRNLAALDAAFAGTACERLLTEAGWCCVVRVPRTVHTKPFAEAALDAGVLVQPGSFYGLSESRIVLSLLTPTEVWDAGVEALRTLASSEERVAS